MNITKKQHYIPQFHLKNFTDNNSKIWILNKNNNRLYKNSIENVCARNYLYETKWKEPFINQKFISANIYRKNLSIREGGYATLLRQIIKMCNDKTNEKGAISYFIKKAILDLNMYIWKTPLEMIFITSSFPTILYIIQ